MIIGLLGFEFESSNKGCEALTYSVFPILEKLEKNSHIVVFNIHDSLGYIPSLYPSFSFENIITHTKSPSFWRLFTEKVKECDVVLDITHGDSFSDIYGTKWFFKTSLMKQMVLKSGTPLIMLPQTYGPYSNRFAYAWAKSLIKKSYRVYTRDSKSRDYLINTMNIKSDLIFNTSDLAFSLPYKPVKIEDNKIKVGINISGLLWTHDEVNINNIKLTVDYKEYCKRIIEWLDNSDEYSIYLIPHVICDEREGIDYYDNDCSAAKLIKDAYPSCIYKSDFDTVVDVKNYIASMDILVAARMHASIGAYSSGVCSIPFAYSRKFSGVYDDLNYKYIIDGTSLSTDDAVNKTIKYIENYKKIQNETCEGMKIVKKNNNDFIYDLTKVMEMLS